MIFKMSPHEIDNLYIFFFRVCTVTVHFGDTLHLQNLNDINEQTNFLSYDPRCITSVIRSKLRPQVEKRRKAARPRLANVQSYHG